MAYENEDKLKIKIKQAEGFLSEGLRINSKAAYNQAIWTRDSDPCW